MAIIVKKQSAPFLYQGAYDYYKEQILSHKLGPGTRLPSIRKTSEELGLSRTTIEAAYNLLADEGFIIARPGSGYYVTQVAARRIPDQVRPRKIPYRFDLASGAADPSSFRLDNWKRYLKNALRQEKRLLSYGEPQGEQDLREALCEYLSGRRNILCSPEEIVIGAGTQSLLGLLAPVIRRKLAKDEVSVSLPTQDFVHQSRIFEDHGYQIFYRNPTCDCIYVSPAAMTKWGEIMDIERRQELVSLALRQDKLILEDDYGSEFIYSSQPAPALYGLGGGRNVVFLGSFSRLLLPSIPLSFMVLPPGLAEEYSKVSSQYHQSASKAEQIALAQYLSDGRLESQLRIQRRIYSAKLVALRQSLHDTFGEAMVLRTGPSGTRVLFGHPFSLSKEELKERADSLSLRLPEAELSDGKVYLLLSCSSLRQEEIPEAIALLRRVLIPEESPGE